MKSSSLTSESYRHPQVGSVQVLGPVTVNSWAPDRTDGIAFMLDGGIYLSKESHLEYLPNVADFKFNPCVKTPDPIDLGVYKNSSNTIVYTQYLVWNVVDDTWMMVVTEVREDGYSAVIAMSIAELRKLEYIGLRR
jgi:hypothetical protein